MNYENSLTPLFIIRTCKQRNGRFEHYQKFIPDLLECYDNFEGENTSMQNMRKALIMAIERRKSAVFIEDDIILCNDFYNKILAEISKYRYNVIQFFSMRKDDLTIGSRFIAGRKYLMNQCFYMPLEISRLALKYFDEFEQNRTDNNIGGTDSLIQYVLKKHKFWYWNVVPNLVNHIDGVSAIDKRRSSKRQSLTFRL
ncbi:hypothetical protein FACS189434_07820 [Bacteroidia bacterium]|nr:hypothetical protein FACS189434_07820 [Bacteroidia bacterium]